jgi:hypothetical protein
MIEHIGNSFHQLFLYLPNTHHPFLGLDYVFYKVKRSESLDLESLIPEYFSEDRLNIHTRRMPYYWVSWDGKGSGISYIPISLNLLLISMGLASTWKVESKVVALMITTISAHILIWAFAGYSGNRFIKLIDWMPLVFYAIGIMVGIQIILQWIFGNDHVFYKILNRNKRRSAALIEKKPSTSMQLLPVILLVLIGWSPPTLEAVIPPQYTDQEKSQILAAYDEAENTHSSESNECLAPAQLEKQFLVEYGKALYPRYFAANESLNNDRRKTIFISPYPRVDFYLVGTFVGGVSIPELDPSEIFTHGSDVIVSGVLIDRFIEARCIYILDNSTEKLIAKRINCVERPCTQSTPLYETSDLDYE